MLRRAPSNPPGLNLAAEGCRMEITRRNFRHSIDRRLATWTELDASEGQARLHENRG
jgi:hypothetical protein